MPNNAVFLDRDGTINIDKRYVHKAEDLVFLPNSVRGLSELQKAGYLLIIITNQSGIGRGYFTERDYREFMKVFNKRLKQEGITIASDYYCKHKEEDKCNCRKPKTELVEKAIKKYKIHRDGSFFIGDKEIDILTGKNAGLKTISLSRSKNSDFSCKDLYEASKVIKKN